MARVYGHAGGFTAQNGGLRSGQSMDRGIIMNKEASYEMGLQVGRAELTPGSSLGFSKSVS